MKTFKKEDLKTGMRAILRSGETALFIGDLQKFVGKGGHRLNEFTDNFNHRENSRFDIISIHGGYDHDMMLNLDSLGSRVWEHKENIPELTMEEVIDKLGYEIKIKK